MPSGDGKPLRTYGTVSRRMTERPLNALKPGNQISGSASQKSTGAGSKSKSSTSLPTTSPVQPTPKSEDKPELFRPLPKNVHFKKNKSGEQADQPASNKSLSSPSSSLHNPQPVLDAEASHNINNLPTPQSPPLSPITTSPKSSRKAHVTEKLAPAALTRNGVKPGMASAVADYSKPSAPAKKPKSAPDSIPTTSARSQPSAPSPAKSTVTKPKKRSDTVDPSLAFRELQFPAPLERDSQSSTVTTKKQKVIRQRPDASVPKQEVESEDHIPRAQAITKKNSSTVKAKISQPQGSSKQTQKPKRGVEDGALKEQVVVTHGHKNRRTMKRHREEVDEDQSTGPQPLASASVSAPPSLAKGLQKSKPLPTELPDELAFSDNETLPLAVPKPPKKNKKRKLDIPGPDGVSLEVKTEMIDPAPSPDLPIPSSSSAANLPALPTAIAKSMESISSVAPPVPTPRDTVNRDPSSAKALQDPMMVVEVATTPPRPVNQNEEQNILPLPKPSSTGPNLEEFTVAHRSMVKPSKSGGLPSFSHKQHIQAIPASAPVLDAAQDDKAMEVFADPPISQQKDETAPGSNPMPVEEAKKKKAETSVRKRKSEAALGGDSMEGGTEKAAKKRRTKTYLKQSDIPVVSEVAPSVSAIASSLASTGPELPPGFLALTPTIDDKQAVHRQIRPPVPDQPNGIDAASTPVPSPKKRGRKPKAATGTEPATPTASSTPRRKKKPPVDVVKQEQPIVKVEGAGVAVFNEDTFLEAASAMADAGARKPGPKAGLKKNQAFASSGHQDTRWTLPPAEVYASAVDAPLGLIKDTETRKPFVWTSSKEELTSAIPALSKSVNGVSWVNLRYPVVLIEEESATGVLGFDAQAEEGKFCLKLIMTRDYVCPPELLDTHSSSPLSAESVSQMEQVTPQPVPVTAAIYPIASHVGTIVDAHPVSASPAVIQPGTTSHPADDSINSIPFRPMSEFDGLGPPVPPPVEQDYSALFECGDESVDTKDEDTLLDFQYPDELELAQARDDNATLNGLPSNLPPEPSGVAGTTSETLSQTSCAISVEGYSHDIAPNEPIPRHEQATLDRLASILDNSSLHVMEPEALDSTPATLAGSHMPMGPTYQLPTHLPVELNAILQAYISSSPVILVGSTEVIKQTLKVKVKKECGLAYLGFFRIRGVEEEALPYTPKKDPGIEYVTGRIQWRFTCEWVTSGQELKAGGLKPWWTPLTKGEGRHVKKSPSCHNRHYVAWSKHPNHNMPHGSDRHWSVLPEYAITEHVAGTAFGVKDESLPAGWHCTICGKLNFQEMLRLRRCDSTICKQRATPPQGYALTLGQIRDPMQKAQMSHPFNVYPTSVVEAFVDQWEDSMQTFSYVSKADPAISVKHVFTGNMPALQQEATKLFEDIQKTVPLAKARGSNSPYFEYRLEADKDGAPWKNAPPCLTLARDVMVYYGNTYGELDAPKIRKLTLSAWVTSGSKRATSPFSCVKHSIVIMFLGSEAIITLTPNSGLPDPQGTDASSRVGLEIQSQSTGALPLQVENGDLIEDISPSSAPAAASRESDDTMIVDVGMQDAEDPEMTLVDESGDGPLPVELTPVLDTSTPAAIPKKGKEKPEKRSIVVTMVHGDVLILSGDKFDYSIKRAGTGILMIGEQR